ncbi:MAG: hypothetical protein JHC87_05905 [Thermoleophilaceae bacterium]|nr:hypothetical protein [Thermoleophilaceae bacterium]
MDDPTVTKKPLAGIDPHPPMELALQLQETQDASRTTAKLRFTLLASLMTANTMIWSLNLVMFVSLVVAT